MGYQRVPETAQATVLGGFSDSVVSMTFYWRQTSLYTPATLQTLADTIDGWGGIQMRPRLGSDCNYYGTEVRGLNAQNDLLTVGNAASGAGTGATVSLPLNVALAISRISGLTGRNARGRVYVFGIPEGMASGNFVLPGHIDSWVAALENLVVACGLVNWRPVIVSRYLNKALRSEAVTYDQTGWRCLDNRIDSQRGRLT